MILVGEYRGYSFSKLRELKRDNGLINLSKNYIIRIDKNSKKKCGKEKFLDSI